MDFCQETLECIEKLVGVANHVSLWGVDIFLLLHFGYDVTKNTQSGLWLFTCLDWQFIFLL